MSSAVPGATAGLQAELPEERLRLPRSEGLPPGENALQEGQPPTHRQGREEVWGEPGFEEDDGGRGCSRCWRAAPWPPALFAAGREGFLGSREGWGENVVLISLCFLLSKPVLPGNKLVFPWQSLFCLWWQPVSDLPVFSTTFSHPVLLRRASEGAAGWASSSQPGASHHLCPALGAVPRPPKGTFCHRGQVCHCYSQQQNLNLNINYYFLQIITQSN